MLPAEVIRAKRDGHALDAAQIDDFVRGLVDRSWSEGQAAALAMAILLRGMARDETAALTRAMAHSGTVLDWSRAKLAGPIVDKHSTGGVGDKVSLMLAPIAAACGAVVPMETLGHHIYGRRPADLRQRLAALARALQERLAAVSGPRSHSTSMRRFGSYCRLITLGHVAECTDTPLPRVM